MLKLLSQKLKARIWKCHAPISNLNQISLLLEESLHDGLYMEIADVFDQPDI